MGQVQGGSSVARWARVPPRPHPARHPSAYLVGLDAVAARHRAVMAVSMFLGHLQLARAAPASLPDDDAAWHEHVDAVTDTLLDLRGSAA